MEKKSTRDKIMDAVGSARGSISRGMGKVAKRLGSSADEYKKNLDNEQDERKKIVAAAHYVNTVSQIFLNNNKKDVFKLYEGTFAEELADAYSELFNYKRSRNTVLQTANREFFNHIAGHPIPEIRVYYNIDAAIGTFNSVSAIVRERLATKHLGKGAKFENLKNTKPEIYKEFNNYYEEKIKALNKVRNRAIRIKKGSEDCKNRTGFTYAEKLLADSWPEKGYRSEQGVTEDKEKAKKYAETATRPQGVVEKVDRLKKSIIERRAKRREAMKQGVVGTGLVLGGVGVIAGAVYGITKLNKPTEQSGPSYEEMLQQLANDYGYKNIDELRGAIGENIGALDMRDVATMQNSIKEIVLTNKLKEINEETSNNFGSVEEFMATATKHSQTREMNRDQYLKGITNSKGQEIFEGVDGEHKRRIGEIYEDFATEHGFIGPDGKIDMDALNNFVEANTQEGLKITEDVISARLLQAKLEAEGQRYEAKRAEANTMEWPQDITYYDGKWSNYIDEVNSIEDIFSTENGMLLHLDELTANCTNPEKFQAILIDAQNRFGENWDNAVGWEEGWANIAEKPSVDTAVPPVETPTPELPLGELSTSDQDILDHQTARLEDGVADTMDKGSDSIHEAVMNSVEIVQQYTSMNLGGPAAAIDFGDVDTHGVLDAVGDHLAEFVASSAIISGAIMASRMWLMRHNILKRQHEEERQQRVGKELAKMLEQANDASEDSVATPKN